MKRKIETISREYVPVWVRIGDPSPQLTGKVLRNAWYTLECGHKVQGSIVRPMLEAMGEEVDCKECDP